MVVVALLQSVKGLVRFFVPSSAKKSSKRELYTVQGKKYDLNQFVHPGGEHFLDMFAGRDCTEAFLSYHRRPFPAEKMKKYLVSDVDSRSKEEKEAEERSTKQLVELSRRVNAVLRGSGHAPWHYFLKAAVILGITVYLEVTMLLHGRTLALSALLGLFFAFIGLAVQHDANHGAVSRKGWVNFALGMTLDYIGGSSVSWSNDHNVLHHVFPNDINKDPDIQKYPVYRNQNNQARKPVHGLQQFYMFLVMPFYGLQLLIRALVRFKNYLGLGAVTWGGFVPTAAYLARAVGYYHAGTFLFVLRFVVLPLYLDFSLFTVLSQLVTVGTAGGYLGFFFFMSHSFEGVAYTDGKKVIRSDGSDIVVKKDVTYVERQALTASSVGGPILSFFNGGLNYQIEHHIFPRIHHAHYATIAPVVRAFCEEKGIKYHAFPWIHQNVISTWRYLRGWGLHALSKKL